MFEMLGASGLLVVIIKLDRSNNDMLHRFDETDSHCVWGIAISKPVVLNRLYNGEDAIQVAPHRPLGPANFRGFHLEPIYLRFYAFQISLAVPIQSHKTRRQRFGRW